MKFFIKFLMILLSFVAQMQLHNGGGGKLCCCFERFETTTKKIRISNFAILLHICGIS